MAAVLAHFRWNPGCHPLRGDRGRPRHLVLRAPRPRAVRHSPARHSRVSHRSTRSPARSPARELAVVWHPHRGEGGQELGKVGRQGPPTVARTRPIPSTGPSTTTRWHRMVKRWSDLSERTRRLLLIAAAVEAVLKVAMLVDLRRRPASQVRGSKRLWAASARRTRPDSGRSPTSCSAAARSPRVHRGPSPAASPVALDVDRFVKLASPGGTVARGEAMSRVTTERHVIDFDHHNAEFRDDNRAVVSELHASGCPLGWSEHHGGYWALYGYQAVYDAVQDPELFSSAHSAACPKGVPSGAYDIPLVPIDVDGPMVKEYRRIVLGTLSPVARRPTSRVPRDRHGADRRLHRAGLVRPVTGAAHSPTGPLDPRDARVVRRPLVGVDRVGPRQHPRPHRRSGQGRGGRRPDHGEHHDRAAGPPRRAA